MDSSGSSQDEMFTFSHDSIENTPPRRVQRARKTPTYLKESVLETSEVATPSSKFSFSY